MLRCIDNVKILALMKWKSYCVVFHYVFHFGIRSVRKKGSYNEWLILCINERIKNIFEFHINEQIAT